MNIERFHAITRYVDCILLPFVYSYYLLLGLHNFVEIVADIEKLRQLIFEKPGMFNVFNLSDFYRFQRE